MCANMEDELQEKNMNYRREVVVKFMDTVNLQKGVPVAKVWNSMGYNYVYR